RTESGAKAGCIEAVFQWQDEKGAALLSDIRKYIFYAHPTLRMFDVEITVKAIVTARFGDAHEASFTRATQRRGYWRLCTRSWRSSAAKRLACARGSEPIPSRDRQGAVTASHWTTK